MYSYPINSDSKHYHLRLKQHVGKNVRIWLKFIISEKSWTPLIREVVHHDNPLTVTRCIMFMATKRFNSCVGLWNFFFLYHVRAGIFFFGDKVGSMVVWIQCMGLLGSRVLTTALAC